MPKKSGATYTRIHEVHGMRYKIFLRSSIFHRCLSRSMALVIVSFAIDCISFSLPFIMLSTPLPFSLSIVLAIAFHAIHRTLSMPLISHI